MSYMDAIDDAINDYPVVSESLFKEFLPLFFDEMEPAERSALMDRWLDYAKDPRVPVCVAEDGKLENILFQIPPMVHGPDLEKNANLISTLHMWNLTMHQSPLHGRAFARQNLRREMMVGEMSDADRAKWKEIYERYRGAGPKANAGDAPLITVDDDW